MSQSLIVVVAQLRAVLWGLVVEAGLHAEDSARSVGASILRKKCTHRTRTVYLNRPYTYKPQTLRLESLV